MRGLHVSVSRFGVLATVPPRQRVRVSGARWRQLALAEPPNADGDGSDDDSDGDGPRQRVKFRHPDTGEAVGGHLHAAGHQGATIVDEGGNAHKVPHGHYLHDTDDDGDGDGPDPAALADKARRHIELGAKSKTAIVALAALLKTAGIADPLALKGSDVALKDGAVLIHPNKRRVRDAGPALELLSDLVAAASDDKPFLQTADGAAPTPDDLDQYEATFSAAKPLEQASAGAFLLPTSGDPERTWLLGDFTCEFRSQPNGLGLLTLRKASHPLPYHEITGGLHKAIALARQLVTEWNQGKTPKKGIFRKDGR